MIFTKPKLGICVVACALVYGCGGGGSSSPASNLLSGSNPTLDKYAGSWVSDCQIATGRSEIENVTFSILSQDTLSASSSVKSYATNNCLGASTVVATSYTIRFDGVKVAGANVNGPIVVDKITITLSPGSTYKDIAWVFQNGTFRNEIYTGNIDAGASIDPEGYPNSLEITPTLSRPL